MEYDKINNLLARPRGKLPKFITKRSDLCDFPGAYVLVKGIITVTSQDNVIRDKKNRPLVLKNNAPFISCISKINGELIENAEDLDVVIPMYNLLEYSKNYKKTTGSLFNYCRDELSSDANDNNSPNTQIINSESFKYKKSITGNTYEVALGDNDYDATKEGEK